MDGASIAAQRAKPTSESAADSFVRVGEFNSTPIINRIKGGAHQTWTNIGKPAYPPGSKVNESNWFSLFPPNVWGPMLATNHHCVSPAPWTVAAVAGPAASAFRTSASVSSACPRTSGRGSR